MSSAPRVTRPDRLTASEYLALPSDDVRTELIYGEIVVAAAPTDEHQDLLHNLGEILRRWVRHDQLGKVSFDIDMVLDEEKGLVYRPDLLYLSTEHDQRRKHGRYYGPADLVIEILSPSDRPSVRGRKYSDYERYGVPWYWTVHPDSDEPVLEENELVKGAYVCRTEVRGDAWFAPALFPGLIFRLPPLPTGDLKKAVKGKAKKLM